MTYLDISHTMNAVPDRDQSNFLGYGWLMPFCVHASGLASPTALQSPVLSKPKNSSPAISKPHEGQFCPAVSLLYSTLYSSVSTFYTPFSSSTPVYPLVTCYVTVLSCGAVQFI